MAVLAEPPASVAHLSHAEQEALFLAEQAAEEARMDYLLEHFLPEVTAYAEEEGIPLWQAAGDLTQATPLPLRRGGSLGGSLRGSCRSAWGGFRWN